MFLKDTCTQYQWLTILLLLYVICMCSCDNFVMFQFRNHFKLEEVKTLSQEWIVLQNEEDISLFTLVWRDTLPDIEAFVITRSLVLNVSLGNYLFMKAANHLPALSCIGEVLNLELFKKLMVFIFSTTFLLLGIAILNSSNTKIPSRIFLLCTFIDVYVISFVLNR